MDNGVPSRLVFLSELGQLNEGDKVRFLGCIQSYSPKSSTPYLAHQYPPDAKRCVVHLDADHVLGAVQPTDWAIGSWVNVVGYIAPIPPACVGSSCGREFHEQGKPYYVVHVQAIMLWPTGPLYLDKYEKALEARRAAAG